MKKQYFIFLAITCMVIFNVKAQNTPIDDFLKKFESHREGITHVSISQQMLKAIFTRPKKLSLSNPHIHNFWMTHDENFNVPEAYSSISIVKPGFPVFMEMQITNFKKIIFSSNYEVFMEMNNENKNVLAYYLRKENDKNNEIVVLRKQDDQFSAIYIRGDIEVNQVDNYLRLIKLSLDQQMRTTQTNMFLPDHQYAFVMPSFDDFKMIIPSFNDFKKNFPSNFQFDKDAFNRSTEEVKRMEARRKIEEAKLMEAKFRMKEAERRMIKSAEEARRRMKDMHKNHQNAVENIQKQEEGVNM